LGFDQVHSGTCRKITIARPHALVHCTSILQLIKDTLVAEGIDAEIYQVPETLPAEVLEKMHAPAKAADPILDPHRL
jgi:hypothetical protein